MLQSFWSICNCQYISYHFVSLCLYLFGPLPEIPFPLPMWWIPSPIPQDYLLFEAFTPLKLFDPHQMTSYISLCNSIDYILAESIIYINLPSRLLNFQKKKRLSYLSSFSCLIPSLYLLLWGLSELRYVMRLEELCFSLIFNVQ